MLQVASVMFGIAYVMPSKYDEQYMNRLRLALVVALNSATFAAFVIKVIMPYFFVCFFIH